MIGPQRPPKNYDNLVIMIQKAVVEAESANDCLVQWRLSWHYKLWADLAEQEVEEATGATVKRQGQRVKQTRAGVEAPATGDPHNRI